MINNIYICVCRRLLGSSLWSRRPTRRSRWWRVREQAWTLRVVGSRSSHTNQWGRTIKIMKSVAMTPRWRMITRNSSTSARMSHHNSRIHWGRYMISMNRIFTLSIWRCLTPPNASDWSVWWNSKYSPMVATSISLRWPCSPSSSSTHCIYIHYSHKRNYSVKNVQQRKYENYIYSLLNYQTIKEELDDEDFIERINYDLQKSIEYK